MMYLARADVAEAALMTPSNVASHLYSRNPPRRLDLGQNDRGRVIARRALSGSSMLLCAAMIGINANSWLSATSLVMQLEGIDNG
jgi:hypothetical protein